MAGVIDVTIALFSFPAVQGKKITAAFDGARITSDGGVMLLSMAERRIGVAERSALHSRSARSLARRRYDRGYDPRPGSRDLLRLRRRRRAVPRSGVQARLRSAAGQRSSGPRPISSAPCRRAHAQRAHERRGLSPSRAFALADRSSQPHPRPRSGCVQSPKSQSPGPLHNPHNYERLDGSALSGGGRAPVIIATASAIENAFGSITVRRRPSRWMWMRSATSNT